MIGWQDTALDPYRPETAGWNHEHQIRSAHLFFYCYTCKDYELKTSPHFAEQKARFADRRKAEAAKASKAKKQGQRKGKKTAPEAPLA